MKWKSHIALVKAVLSKMPEYKYYTDSFVDGSIYPDKHRETNLRGRFISHHWPPKGVFMRHVFNARKALYRNKKGKAL